MSTAWFFAVCVMAAPADAEARAESQTARTTEAAQPAAQAGRETADLPRAVYDALRRFRRSSVREREALVPELVALHEHLQRNTALEPKQRNRLVQVLERRLQQAERTLRRRVAREERAAKSSPAKGASKPNKPAVATVKSASARPRILAQQVGAQAQAGGGGGLGGPQGGLTAANAQQLIDLIRATICPDTWAAGGGNGRIFYYSPLQVLVVTR